MATNRQDIIEQLHASLHTIHHDLQHHCCIVEAIFGDSLGVGRATDNTAIACPKREREQRLENALKDAIDTLEESRKSFKSKQLAALRKRLTEVLTAHE